MRAGLVVTGVLGLGSAMVFALAALTATLFPNGTLVHTTWNGPMVERGWGVGGGWIEGAAPPMPLPMPLPVPDVEEGDAFIEGDGVLPDGTLVRPVDPGIFVDPDFEPLPGDTVDGELDTKLVPVP